MADIDYEAEYNNRARVPEHPEIFAGWARDAAAYRAERAKHSEVGVVYGNSPRQTLDFFFADKRDNAPLALFIHGGWWRSLEPLSFSHMARGLNAHGVNVAVAGYDLCPQVSVRDIFGQMQAASLTLWRRFQQRFAVSGHSAGGHLTACLVATDWSKAATNTPADLVPNGYAISGVFDLTPFVGISVNDDLRLTPDEARAMSPPLWTPPPGRTLDAVVGGIESAEFLRQSQDMAEAWRGKAATRYEALPNMNHFTAIAPLADPDSNMTKRLRDLAVQAHR